ncbi:MAG: hypothetical protein P8107_15470 [Spirochaetia bacterium]|jgi:hypothetical protein
MKKLKIFLVIFILISIVSPLIALNETSLYLYVQEIGKAGPPQVYDDSVIFTYQATGKVYYVGARFAHENYTTLHKYVKNAKNLFVLVMPIPEDVTQLKYRIVVDGLWMKDPFNEATKEDELGIEYSLVMLPQKHMKYITSPEILPNGMVKFTLKARAGSSVFIAGDFNNWDPFTNMMQEETEGLYTISLKLYPGRHYYYFLINGKRMIDPYNTQVFADRDGLSVSGFFLPR